VAFDRFKRAREEAGIDLIPVMNLFVVLIPFLLLSAAFFHVGVIPTSLPAPTSGTSDAPPDMEKVTVTLRLESDAVHLSLSHPAIAAEVLDGYAARFERDGSEHAAVRDLLAVIKNTYANSDTVVVLPGDGVTYREVVQLLDAARSLESGSEGDGEPLFPVVVLSRSA
jgi:biopolymer transport protein ExbD